MGGGCGSSCPTGYSCGTANGIEVCRAKSGIPLFTSVFVIVMENTSLGTLQIAMNNNGAPQLAALKSKYATGADYHGVTHPSVPNYLALTSGDTQGAMCDCSTDVTQPVCTSANCNGVLGSCYCGTNAKSIADQLEAGTMSWQAFGENMGTPCNPVDAGNYTAKHVPFLYYTGVLNDAARCRQHVVDLSSFDPNNPPRFSFIVPNTVHDMEDPRPATAQNILNGDGWIGPQVSAITSSSAYKRGGLLVVVWDEDDASGGVGGSDDPIPIFLMSPFAKSNDYVSTLRADHYSMLATLEDGLMLPRIGNAVGIAPLADYFPSK